MAFRFGEPLSSPISLFLRLLFTVTYFPSDQDASFSSSSSSPSASSIFLFFFDRQTGEKKKKKKKKKRKTGSRSDVTKFGFGLPTEERRKEGGGEESLNCHINGFLFLPLHGGGEKRDENAPHLRSSISLSRRYHLFAISADNARSRRVHCSFRTSRSLHPRPLPLPPPPRL